MTKFLLNAVLMFVLGTGGFAAGALLIGRIINLRQHPRYLMAIGAAAMPLVWAGHVVVGTNPMLFGVDLMIMMAGVGIFAAGWESELDMEHERDVERVKRLRAAWEQRTAAMSAIEPDDTSIQTPTQVVADGAQSSGD